VPISFVLLGVFAYRPLVAYRPILASIDSFGGNSGGNFLNETMPRDADHRTSDGRDTGAALGRVPILAAFSCPARNGPSRGRASAFLLSA
jgi:hypothetical protein